LSLGSGHSLFPGRVYPGILFPCSFPTVWRRHPLSFVFVPHGPRPGAVPENVLVVAVIPTAMSFFCFEVDGLSPAPALGLWTFSGGRGLADSIFLEIGGGSMSRMLFLVPQSYFESLPKYTPFVLGHHLTSSSKSMLLLIQPRLASLGPVGFSSCFIPFDCPVGAVNRFLCSHDFSVPPPELMVCAIRSFFSCQDAGLIQICKVFTYLFVKRIAVGSCPH